MTAASTAASSEFLNIFTTIPSNDARGGEPKSGSQFLRKSFFGAKGQTAGGGRTKLVGVVRETRMASSAMVAITTAVVIAAELTVVDNKFTCGLAQIEHE